MFYTPKPRQFSYKPRFYDPEKEKWEALKARYQIERELEEREREQSSSQRGTDYSPDTEGYVDVQDADLAYFQRRLREMDRKETRQGLTWKDLFRKREMPTFRYQPRFQNAEDVNQSTGEHIASFKRRNTKISRRFDITDKDYMKPVPASRIMLYTLLVCLLLYWILF